jgi:hypothetical protein
MYEIHYKICDLIKTWNFITNLLFTSYELEPATPKVNMWCGVTRDKMYGPFIFAKETVHATYYPDMLQEFVLPQLTQDGVLNTIIFQHNGAPPHWALIVPESLDDTWTITGAAMMGPSHGRRIPRTWRLRTILCRGTSNHLYMDKDHRMKLTSNRRSPRPLHRSLWKCCMQDDATCLRGMNCAASAAAVMLSVNMLGHESGVPPMCERAINW